MDSKALLNELDQSLARRYGSYASYPTAVDPVFTATFGDNPADEVDRLLDALVTSEKVVLDLGCGAGHTLCRIAPNARAAWGFDEDADLLAASRRRVEYLALANVTLVHGNVAVPEDVARLPADTFDLALSRRGPNVNTHLASKLRSDAHVIQELYRSPLGLLQFFGREPFWPEVETARHTLVGEYRRLGLLPVSVKDYFYEAYFQDAEHLARYLAQEKQLSAWWMPDLPYEETRDGTALDLYVRYNMTEQGIRLLCQRSVYLFRRAEIRYYPAMPEARPLYSGFG